MRIIAVILLAVAVAITLCDRKHIKPYKDIPAGETCWSCFYWVEDEHPANTNYGECRESADDYVCYTAYDCHCSKYQKKDGYENG